MSHEVVRPFCWGDLPSLAELVSEAGEDNFLGAPLEERLRCPGYDPRQDLFLVEQQGEPVAYLDVIRETAVGRVVFEVMALNSAARKEVLSTLLGRGIEHASTLGVPGVHISVAEEQEDLQECLKAAGFHLLRRSLEMEFDQPELPAVPPTVSIRRLGPGEETLLAQLQNCCFAGSWGFQPNTAEEICYRLGLSCCSPWGIFLGTQEQEVVGYCWTRELRGEGNIWMMGVKPEGRRHGMGKALLLQGMHYLRQRGWLRISLTVQEENVAAFYLYRSIGFVVRSSTLWYGLKLR